MVHVDSPFAMWHLPISLLRWLYRSTNHDAWRGFRAVSLKLTLTSPLASPFPGFICFCTFNKVLRLNVNSQIWWLKKVSHIIVESAQHGLTCDCFPHFCNLTFATPGSRPYSWAIWDFWFNGSMVQSICDCGAVQSAVCLSECLAAVSVCLLGATRHFVLFLCKICAEIVAHRMFAASLNGLNKETKGQRNPGAGPPCTILEANTSPATLKKNLNFWRRHVSKNFECCGN